MAINNSRTRLLPLSRSLTVGLAAISFLIPGVSFAAKILSVDFRGTQDPNLLEIRADAPVTVERQDNAQDNQVVLELKGATISKAVGREIDTSSFNSKVTLIKSYQVKGQPDTVRVVIQLRETTGVEVSQDGNTVKLSIPSGGGGSTSSSASGSGDAARPSGESTAIADESNTGSSGGASGGKASASDSINQSKAGGDVVQAGNLDNAIDGAPGRRYTGRPITLQVRDMEASDIFRLIGEASGFNIVLADDVKGKLTLSLVDVPWDQALAVVLQSLKLGAERNNNILRITTLSNLTASRQEAFKASQASEQAAPRITRVFPISYAKLVDLQAILMNLLYGKTGAGAVPAAPIIPVAGGAPSPAGATGLASMDPLGMRAIATDERTNSLIVRDTAANVERVQKLVGILDTQTPQVMIEGKVVEASEQFSNAINGNLAGGGNLQGGSFLTSVNGGTPVDPLLGTPGVFANGSAVGLATATGGANNTGLGLVALSFLPGSQRLNAILQLNETEQQARVIASPRLVVLNKESANIVQGTPVIVPIPITSSFGTGVAAGVSMANLSLDVIPTVTNDGSVLMNLTLTRDIPTAAGTQTAIATRTIKTHVLVESGTTLVLGGFYTMDSQKVSSGFPILRKIPILGWLFGSNSDTTTRSELFFFITPQIMNSKKAGFDG